MNISYFSHNFLQLGIAIIPVQYQDKRPEYKLLPNSSWEPFKTRLPTELELNAWLQYRINYGVIAGWNNLAILDFDSATSYTQWSLWATRKGGLAGFTANQGFRVYSARGVHFYVRLAHRERNRKLDKLDIKFDGYVLGPGSVHPSGAVYTAQYTDRFIFPVIETLSDILPVELLRQHTEQTISNLNLPAIQAQDPWTVASKPRASGNVIGKIKNHLRLESLFPGHHKISHDGRWLMVNCPLHDDKHPSMWIDTRDQICGCFAGCTEKPLDVINLYARLNSIDNSSAIGLLAESV